MKRFSSIFKNDRRKSRQFDSKVNGDSASSTNGTPSGTSKAATNGYTNGTPSGTSKATTYGYANGTPSGVNGGAAPAVPNDHESHSGYPEPPDHGKERVDIEAALSGFAGLISHSMRPLPEQTGDGTYLVDDEHTGFFKDLSTIGFKDIRTLADKFKAGGAPIDDKTMLMERVIQLVAGLPDKSLTRAKLTNEFVDQLFTSLQHPPMSYLGDEHKYRKADGSMNNPMFPKMGAANTPYARTVQPECIQPGALPDPDLVFDSLFAREGFRPHPNKNSSIIFYWASIIIHDLFQTDHHDFSNSQTSSYLDLSPLYGDTQEDQDHIRTFKDGKLKPDCFAEHRLLTFPPGCGVILIMFNRFHNYVAEQLAAINENGRFPRPAENAPEKAWKKYDNDLFQTARLVTGGLYMNITLVDYVRTIINLNRSNSTWTLDPRVKESNTAFDDHGTPRGTGNQVSCEFNLVYRWHSAISERDDKWTQNKFQEMWGKPYDQISMPELLMGLGKWEATMPPDPFVRDFAGLKRGADGKFNDDDLVNIICDSIEDVAGAFGANHIPKVMKAVTTLGMKQARAWDCCSLNEFRKFFGLKTHKTFEDINHHPEVAEQLRNLYEQPDHVELYTGLIAEDAKLPMTEAEGGPVGVGISPTYTISRAILSDAVALVRGDRFYTIDYTPKNLTNWGYSEVQYNFNVEQGCNFYKLFLRAFPDHFKPNSIYARMPMTVPEENRKIMAKLGRESHYSFDRPQRLPGRVMIQSYKGVHQVLENAKLYASMWAPACEYIWGPLGNGFMLAGDDKFHAQQRSDMKELIYRDQWHDHVKEFYEGITLRLIKENSKKVGGPKGFYQVDITRDVGNLAHVYFAARVFSLPLKCEENPRGVYSEHELYLVMAAMFVFIFFDVDPVKTFELALGVRAVTQQLGELMVGQVKFVNNTSLVSAVTDKLLHYDGPLSDYGVHMIRRLLATGKTPEQIAWGQILPVAGAMVANQAQVITQILDCYLVSEAGKPHWRDIVALAQGPESKESEQKLLRYCMEGIRLNGTFGSYRRAEADSTLDDTGFSGTVPVKKGDKVFVSFVRASRDATVFPNPDTVSLDPRMRPMDAYIHYGLGPHTCLGKDASMLALTAMLKTIARLPGLRCAPGAQGQLKKIPRDDGFYAYMTEDQGKYFPFPTTWKLHFDGEL